MKNSNRDTRVTEFQNRTWDDRIIQSATGAGAVGMAGAGVGDALAEDGKITLRKSKGHFRGLIKKAEKAGANPRALYKGKKITSQKSAKIIAKLRKRMSRAPVKSRRIGGGKLGLILGGLAGASIPPEKRVMMARGPSTPDAYVMIDGKKYHEFARTRQTDPFEGLKTDPNVKRSRTIGEYKKASAIAKKLVKNTKKSNTVVQDLTDLYNEKRGKQPGVLKTSNGQYRIARANRNSVRVYHKGGPRTRRRKRFYEKKSFRDKAAFTGIAGGTVAGIAIGRRAESLKYRAARKGTSIPKEMLKLPGRMIATSSRVNARNSVRRKYGARKSLGKAGMTGMKNPRSKEGGFTKEARAKTSTQFPKWSESQVNESLSKQQSMAQSGTQVPKKGLGPNSRPVRSLDGTIAKLEGRPGFVPAGVETPNGTTFKSKAKRVGPFSLMPKWAVAGRKTPRSKASSVESVSSAAKRTQLKINSSILKRILTQVAKR